MIIKIVCSCKSTFTINNSLTEDANEISCPCCGNDLPSGTRTKLLSLFKLYKELTSDFEANDITIRSLKIPKHSDNQEYFSR